MERYREVSRPTFKYRLDSGGFGRLRLLDFDFLRLRLRRLRDRQPQHTVRHRRLDAGGIDARWQLKHAIEHTVTAFGKMNVRPVVLLFVVLLLLVLLFAFDPLFAANCQQVVCDGNLIVLAFKPRLFYGDLDLFLVLSDVDVLYEIE